MTHLEKQIELTRSMIHHWETWGKIYAERGDIAGLERVDRKIIYYKKRLIKQEKNESRESTRRRR